MKKVLSDIFDITIALLQTVAVLSYAKIAAMSGRRKTALCLFLIILAMCVIRYHNWHNVGGEVILLAATWTYLYATRPREDERREGTFYDTDM